MMRRHSRCRNYMTTATSAAKTLSQPLSLPNGSVLPNRFAKSAMSEALGTLDNHATERLPQLYKRWAEGETGLLITGNVMVDRNALGEPGNVVIENEDDLPMLQRWAKAGQPALAGGQGHIWVQLNHPGKQIPKFLGLKTVAPSAVPFEKALQSTFTTPRALTAAEIETIIERFARAAAVCEKAGFDGVQIHGAHGYLVSQFLSPHHNVRDDEWGGSLENRMRFVVRIYEAIRAATTPGFAVGIKINSADFQRGGFTNDDALEVCAKLSDLGMDLIEISGGTYEKPAMTGVTKDSTAKREAYFLDFAHQARERISAPLMLTGGFRTAEIMAEVVESGAVDLVGLGRSLAIEPDLPKRILAGENAASQVKPIRTGIGMIDRMGMMETAWYTRQLARMADGKEPVIDENGLKSLLGTVASTVFRSQKMRRMRG